MQASNQQCLNIPLTSLQKIRKLGKGSYGKVYAGKWDEVNEVAIKEFYEENLSQTVQKQMETEILILSQMKHPNVVLLYGYCISPACLVLELMHQSLFNLLHSNQEIDWDKKFQITLEIVQGLKYIHGKGIIHRDLKSLNVLLDEKLRAKICDFGLSKQKVVSRQKSSQQSKSKQQGTLS